MAAALVASTVAAAAPSTPPNFVFLLSESLDGRLLRPGSPALIPNIRRLMSQGVTFDTAYANSPVWCVACATLCGDRSGCWTMDVAVCYVPEVDVMGGDARSVVTR